VTVPFSGQSGLVSGAVDLSTVSYYMVDLYTLGTTTPVAAQQQVNHPGGGVNGTANFSVVTQGTYSLSTRGYDNGGALRVWSDSTATISAGSTATAAPAQTSITPTGFTLQQVSLDGNGNGSVTINGFGASNEAIVVANYNSVNYSNDDANPVVTGGAVTNMAVPASVALLNPAPLSGLAERSASEKKYTPLHDMEYIADKTVECLEKYGVPRPVTRERLKALGRIDANGRMISDTVGSTKDFHIHQSAGTRTATCKYTGTHFVIYVDNSDLGNISEARVNAIGAFMDSTVWSGIQQVFGTVTTLRWSDHIYVLYTSQEAGSDGTPNARFDPGEEYDIANSNCLDMVYSHPTFAGWGVVNTDEDFQGILAHECQHLMRWYNKIYKSGSANPNDYNDPQNTAQIRYDSAIDEGCSQYFECVVGRGFINNGTDKCAQWLRIYNLRGYLKEPQSTSFVGRFGIIYSAGFMAILYLVDHYGGMTAYRKVEAADGKLAMDSIEAAAGEPAASFFLKESLALNLATRAGMTQAYTFSNIDLSGNTKYYGGEGLYPAYYRYTNSSGGDLTKGVDISAGGNSFSWSSEDVCEWCVDLYRFFNGSGNPLTINLTGFKPNEAGGGSVTVYVINK